MDESLSDDFKETLQSHRGPRSKQKLNKGKKKLKCVKGQKDIRKALKQEKNELICYTKEFDKVCVKSGLDVDSEQLQLAIALSKSINPDNCVESSSQIFTTQGRIAKIKTTLAEFGFRVPANKVKTNQLNKHKKKYKLLTTSEEERNHKIAKKYSQVLLKCLDSSKSSINCIYQESHPPAFHIATNLEYKFMKDNSIFCVNDLIEISTTSGSLLRNWAEIPGRPISPKHIAKIPVDVSEIISSQDKLDVFLSGSLKSTNEIAMNFEKKEYGDSDTPIVLTDPGNANKCVKDDSNTRETHGNPESILKLGSKKTYQIIDLVSCSTMSSMDQNRCSSPDLFEDEDMSYKIDTSKSICLSQGQKTKIFTEENNHMDLTECANNNADKAIGNIQFMSQNITKRNSNDLMEMTNCVESKLEPIQVENESDLSLNPIIKPECDDHEDKKTKTEIIDLTSGNRGQDCIDLTQSYNEDKNMSTLPDNEFGIGEIINMDLTQSSKSSEVLEDLPEIQLEVNNSAKIQPHLDDTIILNEEEYTGRKRKMTFHYEDKVINLTQLVDDNVEECAKEDSNEDVPSFFDDYVYDHSDGKQSVHSDDLCADSDRKSNEIDLTQSLDESLTNNNNVMMKLIKDQNINNINNNCSRVENISIDYDEISEHLSNSESVIQKNIDTERLSINSNHNSTQSNLGNSTDSANNLLTNSQNSDIFDLTDKELDYSLHKSRYDIPINDCNFDFGGISVMDDISDITKSKTYLDSNKSNLQKMFISKDNIEITDEIINSGPQEMNDGSPHKSSDCGQSTSGVISVVTPTNNEYIIKTNEVTPMLDYSTMTTPQRNKELDKYGLRPFKRKRAIQILTHLYNQTHPVIEPCPEDQPSPKKPRQQITPHSSPKKILEAPIHIQRTNEILLSPKNSRKRTICFKSPQKEDTFVTAKSPRKGSSRKEDSPKKKQSSKENKVCVYEVTNGISTMTVDCNPDEWVFPKKERNKVQSCQIPLHIAFHNYVSSRRSLREAILRYEPVNIDVIHKDLVSYGQRYDPKDLLRFLDKKCITVKTVDNNARRNKRQHNYSFNE